MVGMTSGRGLVREWTVIRHVAVRPPQSLSGLVGGDRVSSPAEGDRLACA
jgi:hypothetical protein